MGIIARDLFRTCGEIMNTGDILATIRGVLLDLDLVLRDFDSMTSDEIEEVLEDWRQSLLETLPD